MVRERCGCGVIRLMMGTEEDERDGRGCIYLLLISGFGIGSINSTHLISSQLIHTNSTHDQTAQLISFLQQPNISHLITNKSQLFKKENPHHSLQNKQKSQLTQTCQHQLFTVPSSSAPPSPLSRAWQCAAPSPAPATTSLASHPPPPPPRPQLLCLAPRRGRPMQSPTGRSSLDVLGEVPSCKFSCVSYFGVEWFSSWKHES